MSNHPALEPFQFGSTHLRNRAVVAPMSRVSTVGDGVPTPDMARYYGEFAVGGFSLIITEGTYTDNVYSQGYANQPGIINLSQAIGWKYIVETVHSAGARIILQLMHAGALSQCLTQSAGPSSVKPKRHKMPGYGGSGPFPVPKAMNHDDIDTVVRGFVTSAMLAEITGFDGVEVHGANGYLIDQFITDYTNSRVDEYGGDINQRMKLATNIVSSIKDVVSSTFIVGIRLSQGKVNDFDYRWPGGEADAHKIFLAAKEAGADYIHFASEGKGWEHSSMLPDGTSLTALARRITKLPVIANGGMHEPALSRLILSEGHGDLVALGTGALANPDWPKRLAKDLPLMSFNPEMLEPTVTIENTWNWKYEQGLREVV